MNAAFLLMSTALTAGADTPAPAPAAAPVVVQPAPSAPWTGGGCAGCGGGCATGYAPGCGDGPMPAAMKQRTGLLSRLCHKNKGCDSCGGGGGLFHGFTTSACDGCGGGGGGLFGKLRNKFHKGGGCCDGGFAGGYDGGCGCAGGWGGGAAWGGGYTAGYGGGCALPPVPGTTYPAAPGTPPAQMPTPTPTPAPAKTGTGSASLPVPYSVTPVASPALGGPRNPY